MSLGIYKVVVHEAVPKPLREKGSVQDGWLYCYIELLYAIISSPLKYQQSYILLIFCTFMRVFYILSLCNSGGLPRTPGGGYGVGREQLSSMTRDRNFSALQEYGGASSHLTAQFLHCLSQSSFLYHFFIYCIIVSA